MADALAPSVRRRGARQAPGPLSPLGTSAHPAAARRFRLDFTLTTGSPGVAGERFGGSVAAAGDTIIVGGSSDATRGVVAVFDARTGALRSDLRTPDPDAKDGFGAAVAADGAHIAIGAPAAVAVHLYDASGAPRATVRPSSSAAKQGFGRSVAVHAGQIAVGGNRTVHVFDATTARLIRRLDGPLGGVDRFGTAVAFGGQILFVGAPACHTPFPGRVYAYSTRSGALLWSRTGPAPEPDDGFGHALSADGDVVAVGAPRTDGTSRDAAYLLSAHTGTLRRVYRTPPHSRGFGSAVALRGNRLLVGAPDDNAMGHPSGAAYLFATRTGTRLAAFRLSRERSARSGEAVAFADGQMIVGAPGAGVVGVYSL